LDLQIQAAALRLRLGLRRLPATAPGTRADRAEIETLVAHQTGWWEGKAPMRSPHVAEALDDLNRRSWSIFAFSIRDGRVAVQPKPRLTVSAADRRLYDYSRRVFGTRAAQCRVYLEHVLRRDGNRASFDFAFDAADDPLDLADLPIFSLNKHHAAHNLLLPDTDFFDYAWYRDAPDPFTYEAKTPTACFVGASTGGDLVTHDKVRDRAVPRLRAAGYFHGHPDVEFRISRAAACESPEVERFLQAQPWYGPPVRWRDQLHHRFLISMDGHGAAWSRVVRSLRSNSVLLKYESPIVMYYYPALQAGRDYLPIAGDADIAPIIARERAEPGSYRDVAQSGTSFARKFLNPASVADYASLLLARFAALQ
jgi:hypothetical protein